MSQQAQDERPDAGRPASEQVAEPEPADRAPRRRYAEPRLTKQGAIADHTAATDFSGVPPG